MSTYSASSLDTTSVIAPFANSFSSPSVDSSVTSPLAPKFKTIPLPDFGFLNFRLPVSQILIVEDDTSTLQLIKTAAREAYELIRVVSFSSGDDALWYLEYLKRNRQPGPDLAVVDIFLKGDKDGFSVCKFIADEFPETTIVVASSMHPDTFQEKSQELPSPPNFFKKPFQLREMVKFFRKFRGLTFPGKK